MRTIAEVRAKLTEYAVLAILVSDWEWTGIEPYRISPSASELPTVVRAPDTWLELAVDYRAVATRLVIAAAHAVLSDYRRHLAGPLDLLSGREREVLEMIAESFDRRTGPVCRTKRFD